ncbi:MAG: hypothetical protein MUP44_05495 [Anaerolineales bacterium]|nr:hypothetical protein [Anaerolineales bacterium]
MPHPPTTYFILHVKPFKQMDESTDVIELQREDFTHPPAILTAPPPPKRNMQREKRFTDAVIVRRLEGEDVSVPMSAEGVKNANIITAELCRDLLEKVIDDYKVKDKTPTTKEMGELISAAKAVAEMAKAAQDGLSVAGPDGMLAPSIQSNDQFLSLVARISSVSPKNITPSK